MNFGTSLTFEELPMGRSNVYYQTSEPHDSIRSTEQYIASGANLNERGLRAQTPLFRAAAEGRAYSLELLLNAGANSGLRDTDCQIPLTCAALSNHGFCVNVLMEHASDTQVTESIAAAVHCNSVIGMLMLLHGASDEAINARDVRGRVAMVSACFADDRFVTMGFDDSRCFGHLILRANVNVCDAQGFSPLAVATLCNDHYKVHALLERPGIDVNPVVDMRQQTSAYVQSYWRTRDDIIPSLMTPLMIAAYLGTPDIVHLLLRHEQIDTYLTTTGDPSGKTAEEIANSSDISHAIRTYVYRSARGKMAARRIHRFLRDTTCNPVYAAARRSLERLYRT